MKPYSCLSQTHKSPIVLVLVFISSILSAQTTPPATPDKPDEPVRLETFNVTGSNIKRLDVEKALPVTIVTRDQIDIRDASQPSDLLTALPQVTALPGNDTAFATQNARGDNA